MAGLHVTNDQDLAILSGRDLRALRRLMDRLVARGSATDGAVGARDAATAPDGDARVGATAVVERLLR